MTDTEAGNALIPSCSSIIHCEEACTSTTRSALGNDEAGRGSRVLYDIIVFRQLLPITTLNSDEFLSAWWQIVVCHFILWKNGVHHCDVNPGNLMVYKTSDGRWIGVLNDFDLSLTRDSPSAQERTGTVPFMSLGLLTKAAIKDQVKHLYQHNAESLIWVLTWVCICYNDGVFIGKGTDLNNWLIVDAIQCRKEKSSFLLSGRKTAEPAPSHGGISWPGWDLVHSFLDAVITHTLPRFSPKLENHVVFETWFEDRIEENLPSLLLNVRL